MPVPMTGGLGPVAAPARLIAFVLISLLSGCQSDAHRVALAEADKLRQQGHLDAAEAKYVEAYRLAIKRSDVQVANDASRNRVKVASSIAATRPAETTKLVSSDKPGLEFYQTGSPAQDLISLNNYATLLVRARRVNEAADLYDSIPTRRLDLRAASQTDRDTIRYNWARTCELKTNPDLLKAADLYAQVTSGSELERAAVAKGAAAAAQAGPDAIPILADFCRRWIQTGNISEARIKLLASLQINCASPKSSQLVTVIAEALAAEHPDIDAFKSGHAPLLRQIAKRRDCNPIVKGQLTELISAFNPPLLDRLVPRPTVRRPLVEAKYPSWLRKEASKEALQAFGRVLQAGADIQLSKKAWKLAAERYAAAQVADIGNTDAALSLASLLAVRWKEIDPNQELLTTFTDTLFEQKTRKYKENAFGKDTDWLALAGMHSALAMLYETLEQFGSDQDPHSAVFQYLYAIGANRAANHGDPSTLAPLYKKMGDCQVRSGIAGRMSAWQAYISAAEQYKLAQDENEMLKAIAEADKLRPVNTLVGTDMARRDALGMTAPGTRPSTVPSSRESARTGCTSGQTSLR